MVRLPQPGADNGTWGDILNDFLSQIHKQDGTLKDNTVTGASIAADAITATQIADQSITEAQLSSAVQTKLNATAGTPDWSTIVNKPAVIAAGADQAAARTAIGAGTASTKSDIGLGNVDNTSDANKNAAIATLTNKTISGASNTLSNIPESAVTNLVSDLAGKAASSHTHTASSISDSTATGRALLTATDAAAARTAIGAGTGTASTKSDVGLGNVDNTSDATKNSAVATLTNKTLDNTSVITIKDANLTIQDDADTTKQVKFQASGITTGTTRTYTLPDASGNVALTSMLPPIRFSTPTAVIGVSPTDYAYGPRTLTGARMRVSSAPSGSALVTEVQHWDGYVWTTLATLTIDDGSVTDAVATFSQAQVAGNMVRINCMSVGATTPATGVAVDVIV